MQALGATRALNLDGGGSSALVLRDLATGRTRVVNTPSDPVERPVGNAMAVRATCVRR
jgi:exopolysaccharide biosynthesis protein